MYEPTRPGPSHRSPHGTPMAGTPSDFPHRSREEELDIQLAGHLAALLAVTDELRALTPSDELDAASARLAEQVTRLRGGCAPVRASGAAADLRPADLRPADVRQAALHHRAHTLAGRALVVAASRADTTAAILSAERMDAHAAALSDLPELSATH
ncbi:SCO4983 family protein [Streptomyces sp. NPDC004752]